MRWLLITLDKKKTRIFFLNKHLREVKDSRDFHDTGKVAVLGYCVDVQFVNGLCQISAQLFVLQAVSV